MNIQKHKFIRTKKIIQNKKNYSTITVSANGQYLTEFISTVQKLDQSEKERKNHSLLCLDNGEMKHYDSCKWRNPQTFCPALQNGALSMQHYFCEKIYTCYTVLKQVLMEGNIQFKTSVINLLKSTSYVMHQQLYALPTLYLFCIYLRTNSDFCPIQLKLIGFYNRDEKCLQRGTDWVFK